MEYIIKSERRHKIDYNWMNSFYYYSFGSYFNPIL